MKNIDDDKVFCHTFASNITNENEDPEPKSFFKCQNRHDSSKWKDAIQA